MSFTNRQIHLLCHCFKALDETVLLVDMATAFDSDLEEIIALKKAVEDFGDQDPMRPVESELRFRIANIIQAQMWSSEGTPPPDPHALAVAEMVLNNIQLNFELVEKEDQ